MDAPAVGGAHRRSGSSPRSGRVLIVDDEVALGWVMGKVLSETHRVQVTISGKDALGHLLQGQRFDLILCDVSMPTMNGADFHDEVERRLPAQARRIVFVTGGIADPRLRRRLESLGLPVLEKPLDVRHLRKLVASYVDMQPLVQEAGPSSPPSVPA